MLDTLKLVRGAVSDKDLVPVLTHFHFHDGRLQGSDGRISIDAACPGLDFDITVPADKFLKAVDACGGEPKLSLSDTGRLTVSKGNFKASMQTLPHEGFPRRQPLGSAYGRAKAPTDLIDVLKRLRPFVSNDASRPWSMAILIDDGYAYATNNVQLVRCPLKMPGPITVPIHAVDELLRIALPPLTVCSSATPKVVQFEYKDFWMACQQLAGDWPQVASMFKDTLMAELPPDFKSEVDRIAQFSPDVIFPVIKFSSSGISTMEGVYSAQVEGFELPEGTYHAKQLTLCLSEATHADFAAYPHPIHWRGRNIEGILAGVKSA